MNAFNSLSKRERYIAIGVIVALAIFLFDQFLLTPYTTRRDSIALDRAKVTAQLTAADRLFERKRSLTKVWTDIQQSGLKSTRSLAESQAQQAVLGWAQSAGVNVASLKPERDVQQNQFQIISFHVTCNGTMLSLSRLLWAVETAKIPVRLNELQIAPRKDGVDDLTLQMSISTLCLLPDSGKTRVAMASEGSVRP